MRSSSNRRDGWPRGGCLPLSQNRSILNPLKTLRPTLRPHSSIEDAPILPYADFHLPVTGADGRAALQVGGELQPHVRHIEQDALHARVQRIVGHFDTARGIIATVLGIGHASTPSPP